LAPVSAVPAQAAPAIGDVGPGFAAATSIYLEISSICSEFNDPRNRHATRACYKNATQQLAGAK
jgi:hypothetical protein